MIAALVAVFLIAHGFTHLGVWATPQLPGRKASYAPTHSWVLATVRVAEYPARAVAVSLASVTTILYVIAGMAVAMDSGRWAIAAVAAAASGLVLKAIWFHPWLIVGVLLDVGVILAVAQEWPGSLY
jgi:hypothetical protein